MINEFKVGDLVYYPSCSPAIYKLEASKNDNSEFPLVIRQKGRADLLFTTTGKNGFLTEVPSIFHATLETKKFLDQLYGIEFEEP